MVHVPKMDASEKFQHEKCFFEHYCERINGRFLRDVSFYIIVDMSNQHGKRDTSTVKVMSTALSEPDGLQFCST